MKAQSEAASQWLKRLGAVRVDFGEPHFDDQTDKDPLTRMRAESVKAMGKRLGAAPPEARERGVNVVVTALWNIASLSAEAVLVLLDRLRFEAAEDTAPAEAGEEPQPWANPAEQFRDMIVQMQQPPKDDAAPKFLFIAQLSDQQLERASAEAFARARANAQRLARATGRRLGGLTSVHFGYGGRHDGRTDKLMERQRCGALLAGTSYSLEENEIASDDPRPAEFTLQVNVHYALE
jgi:hypothetical protein